MENTLENKKKLFCQYFGQKVVTPSISDNRLSNLHQSIFTYPDEFKNHCLLLKPLSSLSDHDASDLARISLYHPTIEDYCADDVWIGDGDLNPNGDHWFEVGMRCWEGALIINDQTGSICLKDEDDKHEPVHNVMGAIDFLRSNGYALPYMGLSVNKLEDYGWIKLEGE